MVADVTVIGAGLIGLASALEIAGRGCTVALVTKPRPGEASIAAAGMLAPSVERATGPAHDFAMASRDHYPAYLDALAERTGRRVPLNRLGVLQVAINAAGVRGLRRGIATTRHAEWLDRRELAELEPALNHALGAVLSHGDGAVDNRQLHDALHRAAASDPRITTVSGEAARLEMAETSCNVALARGVTVSSAHVVLAAGAWSGLLPGATLARAVVPVRGQMMSLGDAPLRHVAYGTRGYVVPRADGQTLAGSTMEHVGFTARTTRAGLARIRSAAAEICPALAAARVTSTWAGLRPVTPDLLPLLGKDPEHERVIYACGHSRNGVLLTPATAAVVADLVTGALPAHDISQFRPDRFTR